MVVLGPLLNRLPRLVVLRLEQVVTSLGDLRALLGTRKSPRIIESVFDTSAQGSLAAEVRRDGFRLVQTGQPVEWAWMHAREQLRAAGVNSVTVLNADTGQSHVIPVSG